MKRRIHAYGLGTGRSGTSSMAGIFSSCYRAAHEPHVKELATVIPAFQKGLLSKQDFRQYVIYLDQKLQLEFNASFFNTWQLDVLMAEFPDAKFILTIRDCYSWANSVLNNSVLTPSQIKTETSFFGHINDAQGAYEYPKEEKILEERGLFPLGHLFSSWAKINNEILSSVPQSRILVVRTNEIGSKINEIADFINIPAHTLDPAKSHLHKGVRSPNILSQIDQDYLTSKVNLHCKALMGEYFPGFIDRSADDQA